MVAVRVHLLHCFTLIKLVRLYDVVNTLLFAPVDEVGEHELHFGEVKLSRASKPQQVMVIKVQLLQISDLSRNDPLFELGDDLVHFRARVSHETRLGSLFWCRFKESHFSLSLVYAPCVKVV